MCVNIAVPQDGLTWILLLVWLGDAYFGTFIGCWKDKCEVPNNPFLGRRAIGKNTSFHNTTVLIKSKICSMSLPEQEHFTIFYPHEPKAWDLSINACTTESNAAKRELCFFAIFYKMSGTWARHVDHVQKMLIDFKIPPLEVLHP